jgi:hypothetical protein
MTTLIVALLIFVVLAPGLLMLTAPVRKLIDGTAERSNEPLPQQLQRPPAPRYPL